MRIADLPKRTLTKEQKILYLHNVLALVQEDETALEITENMIDPSDFSVRSFILVNPMVAQQTDPDNGPLHYSLGLSKQTVINGKTHTLVGKGTLSFEDIVKLAEVDENATVTYQGNTSGQLSPGERIALMDDLRINAVNTAKA